jgi:hypothetical protein
MSKRQLFEKKYIHWRPLIVITLGQTLTDSIHRMITITKQISIQSMLLRDIWGLFDLGQFDPINQMILLTMIPLSGIHCSIASIHMSLLFNYCNTC